MTWKRCCGEETKKGKLNETSEIAKLTFSECNASNSDSYQ